MTQIRISLDEYRASATKPRRSKYGAKRTWRCAACGGHVLEPEKKPKRGPAPPPLPCPSCGDTTPPLTFDSRAEARRWDDLVQMQRAGLISGLRRQVRYPLHVVPHHGAPVEIGAYVADATYLDADGRHVVEDVKGGKGGKATTTDLARWKFRHFEIEYGVRVTVVC